MRSEIRSDGKARLRLLRVAVRQRLQYRAAEPVRVIFLVQEASLWPKSQPVAEWMMESELFEVTLFCAPHADMSASKDGGMVFTRNEAFSYLSGKYADRTDTAIVDARADGQWADIAALRPHYVFYPRPYDMYLPPVYSSDAVMRCAKCCYIPYGFISGKGFLPLTNNAPFTKNMSLYFASGSDDGAYVQGNMPASLLRKVCFDGYPLLHRWVRREKKTQDARFTLLWTPRWTTDESLGGGCSFFQYQESFLRFAKEHPQMRVIVRPHPLMLENFVSTGQMTRQQAETFVESWRALPNGRIDADGDYMAALDEADVLITDLSSIIIEFFLTGRPVVFCNPKQEYTREFAMAAECFYYAQQWEQIETIVSELAKGHDEKRAQRLDTIEKLEQSAVKPPQAIVKTVLENYHGRRRARRLWTRGE